MPDRNLTAVCHEKNLRWNIPADCCSACGAAGAADLKPEQRALFDIYKELIEINTTDSVGDNTQAARAMAARLVAAGFPQQDVQVLVHPGNAKKGNLVARLRGDGSRSPCCWWRISTSSRRTRRTGRPISTRSS